MDLYNIINIDRAIEKLEPPPRGVIYLILNVIYEKRRAQLSGARMLVYSK